MYPCMASPTCLRLLAHLIRAAASRTFWTAGRSRPIRMAMIAITTSSSMRVNADRRGGDVVTTGTPDREEDGKNRFDLWKITGHPEHSRPLAGRANGYVLATRQRFRFRIGCAGL